MRTLTKFEVIICVITSCWISVTMFDDFLLQVLYAVMLAISIFCIILYIKNDGGISW